MCYTCPIFETFFFISACSRLHEKIEKNIAPGMTAPVVGPRCTIDGNFNPVQCLNRTCFCVNPVTGVIINEIDSINLDTHPIRDLPCCKQGCYRNQFLERNAAMMMLLFKQLYRHLGFDPHMGQLFIVQSLGVFCVRL